LPAEIERRTSSFNARRTLLRSNPSLFISKTRLSIRQIPIFVTERVLKRLAVHAVRAFETEVKQGTRAGLTDDELTEVVDEDGEDTQVKEDEDDGGKRKARKKGERGTGVKQAKIVRQHERVDPVTGKGRSKGYGFLEMLKHADALRVLRWANNNPEVGPLFEKWWMDELDDLIRREKSNENKDEARLKRMKDEQEKSGSRQSKGGLIAEFSIENVQVVQRRSALQKDKTSVRITSLVFQFGAYRLPFWYIRQRTPDGLERKLCSRQQRKKILPRSVAYQLAARRPRLKNLPA
jgi:nucleolar protein 4